MDQHILTSHLTDFIAIPSVSTDPSRHDQVLAAAHFLRGQILALGGSVELVGSTHPLVVGYIKGSEGKKTIGIYGHYDVQPEDPVGEWHSPPFTLTTRDGRLYGRGVADDKAHVMQNIGAIADLVASGSLKHNIVFLFEGEEEKGNLALSRYLREVTLVDLSSVDVWYVTDTGMRDMQTPQIYTGLRGLLYTELTLKTGTRDLHSGIYGNRVYNAANILAEVISDLKDSSTGHVLIPGFYEGIEYPNETEYERLLHVVEEDEVTRHETGQYILPAAQFSIAHSQSSIPHTLLSKLLPSCDVHGIEVGYTGPGAKTVIPRQAMAKVSFRLVPGQDPDQIEELYRSYLARIIPNGIEWELTTYGKEPAFVTSIESEWMRHTVQILEQEFGHPVQYNRSGGSIPAAGILQELYRKPVILTGFTQPDDCIHAPNENMPVAMWEKGRQVLRALYS